MKILVIGGGGREHALAWKLAQSPRVGVVYVAPGNAGTAMEPKVQNVPIPATDIKKLADFAEAYGVAFTVVGPEDPPAKGIVDVFHKRGLKIFGPTQKAAQLESSKLFAKRFMARHSIPTAPFERFLTAAEAHQHVNDRGLSMVVKGDGLAGGKAAFPCGSRIEAHDAIDKVVTLGEAGKIIIIEDFIDGEEASFIVMCDGKHVLALATSQDHKRLLDGDMGPNTGGMGAYSPAPIITSDLHARIMREIVMPTVYGMAAEGIPFTGFLYAGLMITPEGDPKVLEFNCRLGDPETQPIMMRLKSDLVGLIEHGINGTLDQVQADWDPRPALGVVLAAHGYPDKPRKGDTIIGLPDDTEDSKVFHAGTVDEGGMIKTSGGRVVCVTALGENITDAQLWAYEVADKICFNGKQMRRDIGDRALGRTRVIGT
ncbi:MAG: phosphoribosylamine--glycine ligase [bacterium]|nr:phosphoribosylamine--glycine ligase [bacterium]